MPLTSNGILCGCVNENMLFIGSGDSKIRKVNLEGGQWTLTHEA